MIAPPKEWASGMGVGFFRRVSAEDVKARPPDYFIGCVLGDEALRTLAVKILDDATADTIYPRPFRYEGLVYALFGYAAESTVRGELGADDIAWLRAVAVALKTNADLRAAASICLFVPDRGTAWSGALSVVCSFVPRTDRPTPEPA